MRSSGHKRQTTIYTILFTRTLAIFWPSFRDMIRDFPETIYAIDGLMLIVLRKLTVKDL